MKLRSAIVRTLLFFLLIGFQQVNAEVITGDAELDPIFTTFVQGKG